MSIKQNNNKFIMSLTVALLLPLSFYIIAKVLKKDQLAMPRYYNAERIEAVEVDGKQSSDTVFHQVADIKLVNQMGDKVSLNTDLKGKMLLVEVFFTSCQSVCPKLTNNISYFLHRAFKKNDTTVHFVSIIIDSENDSVSVLKQYSEGFNVNPDHWWFLTGNRDSIYNYLRNELKSMVKPSNLGVEELDHTPTLVLIDKNRYVRGYYNGLDTFALRQCAEDIGLISMQKNIKAHNKPLKK
jgi:protein SCO1